MASELTKPFEEKMKKTLTALDSDYGTIRAGRANPHVLDYGGILRHTHTLESGWEYYGSRTSSAADSALGCIPAEGNRKSNQYVRAGYQPQ